MKTNPLKTLQGLYMSCCSEVTGQTYVNICQFGLTGWIIHLLQIVYFGDVLRY